MRNNSRLQYTNYILSNDCKQGGKKTFGENWIRGTVKQINKNSGLTSYPFYNIFIILTSNKIWLYWFQNLHNITIDLKGVCDNLLFCFAVSLILAIALCHE